MVSIALIVLGLGLGVVGLAISAVPLALVGALWIVGGLISRVYSARIRRIRRQLQAAQAGQIASTGRVDTTAAAIGTTADTTIDPVTGAAITPGITAAGGRSSASDPQTLRTMLVLTAITLVSGLSALAVGYFRMGFDAAHQGWRWLPLIAGIPPTALAVIALGMYGIGSAAKATLGEPPTVQAIIVIQAVRDTGVYVNEKPRLEFDLEVRPDGGASYRVTKRATVPFAAMGHVQVGHAFHTKVAGPSAATNMDIDWSSGFDATVRESDEDSGTRLRHLDELRRQGLVTDTEYQTQRARIIGSV